MIAPPPLADRQRTGGKEPRGGLDAALVNGFRQAKAMVVGVFHFTHEIEITGGSTHDATILVAAISFRLFRLTPFNPARG